MTCMQPPELNDRELMTYLDGGAGDRVIAHLLECAHCRHRAAELARFQGRLSAQLYRSTCPPSIEVGEYHLGFLAPDRALAVSQHLAECPHCARELAQLEGFMDELAPALDPGPLEQAKERIKVVIARLVSGGGQTDTFGGPAPVPAYAGLRGGEAGPYLYEAEDIQIAIEIQDDAGQPGRKSILGLAMGAEPTAGLALLWQAEQRVAVVPVDDLGNFVIPALDPGRYQLILSGPMVEVHIQELQIGVN